MHSYIFQYIYTLYFQAFPMNTVSANPTQCNLVREQRQAFEHHRLRSRRHYTFGTGILTLLQIVRKRLPGAFPMHVL